ncbi:uncharacterized protein LOC119066275 [Bradysia coprophila]|uniref:uncharacterized protein LOC119066275 n=1 Tax=Bradysia coprophila TaxID=38358 RepID=UPI00187D7471|nr:uncharacterized protein LOC119066275 [Bradysia coprophila]XP_037024529.1 uncharacterized protein LOC119066275 [Bradysia coprophila]
MATLMTGVQRQVIGIHSTTAIAFTPEQPIAVDRRDYPDEGRIDLPHELKCSHLVHFTDNDFAEIIGLSNTNHFVFRPQQLPAMTSHSFRLSWWSPLAPDNWRTVIENNLPNVDMAEFDIGNSPAFKGDSMCGPIGIVVKWRDIRTEYARSRGGIVTDVEFRILGTFLYTKEIMFGVLVCMKGDVAVRDVFPLIDAAETEAFAFCSPHEFIWKVYSTVSYSDARPSNVFWTWDHLAFGFYCPTTDLIIRDQFCGFTTKKATNHRPMSRSVTNRRLPSEMYADDGILARLRAKTNALV